MTYVNGLEPELREHRGKVMDMNPKWWDYRNSLHPTNACRRRTLKVRSCAKRTDRCGSHWRIGTRIAPTTVPGSGPLTPTKRYVDKAFAELGITRSGEFAAEFERAQ